MNNIKNNIVTNTDDMSLAIKSLQKCIIKLVLVIENNKLIGTITDGDIRRGLEKYGDGLFTKTVEFVMSHEPKWVTADTLAISALELMKKYAITSLFVYSVDKEKLPEGIVHIHDILKLCID